MTVYCYRIRGGWVAEEESWGACADAVAREGEVEKRAWAGVAILRAVGVQ